MADDKVVECDKSLKAPKTMFVLHPSLLVLTSSVKVAELCELIVNLVTCHQHGEPYELPYLVMMACKAIATIVALL